MDTHPLLIEAWDAIVTHPSYPHEHGLVTSSMVADSQLKQMLEAFDAMPEVPGPDGTMISLATGEGRATAKAGWLRGGWADKGLWPADAEPVRVLGQHFRDFFLRQYQRVIDIAANQEPAHG